MKLEVCDMCQQPLAFCLDTDELYCPHCDVCPVCGGAHNCLPDCTAGLEQCDANH